jgi:hypothetical protein
MIEFMALGFEVGLDVAQALPPRKLRMAMPIN